MTWIFLLEFNRKNRSILTFSNQKISCLFILSLNVWTEFFEIFCWMFIRKLKIDRCRIVPRRSRLISYEFVRLHELITRHRWKLSVLCRPELSSISHKSWMCFSLVAQFHLGNLFASSRLMKMRWCFTKNFCVKIWNSLRKIRISYVIEMNEHWLIVNLVKVDHVVIVIEISMSLT